MLAAERRVSGNEYVLVVILRILVFLGGADLERGLAEARAFGEGIAAQAYSQTIDVVCRRLGGGVECGHVPERSAVPSPFGRDREVVQLEVSFQPDGVKQSLGDLAFGVRLRVGRGKRSRLADE